MTNHPPSMLCHCWLGHQTFKAVVFKAICNVLSGMLNLAQLDLKMIGEGFVLFKINSSPTAFYIIS